MPYPDNFNARLFDEFHDAPEPKGPDADEQADIEAIKHYVLALLAVAASVDNWAPITGLGQDAQAALVNALDDAVVDLAGARKRLEA